MEKFYVTELSVIEQTEINAGDSIFHHMGRIAGFIVGTAVSFLDGLANGIQGTKDN